MTEPRLTTPLGFTQSVCPICLAPVPARRERRGEAAWLVKECPRHGRFETPVWQGPPDIEGWWRPKLPYAGGPRRPGDQGCPRDCGLCPQHGQRTCTALLEITARCDLGCPVCFASAGADAPPDPSLGELERLLRQIWDQTGGCNLQISGGEPTMRADLPQVVAAARRVGFGFVQLNTNGLRLAHDPDLAPRLADAGLSSVFLQWDGTRPSDHLALRGRDLGPAKLRALGNAGQAGLGVVLVPTIKPGVNQDQLWALVRLGIAHSPVARGVHFQPMAYFGRYPAPPGPTDRCTLPRIMSGLEEQSGGQVKVGHFSPPGCEHSLCSFSAHYVVNPDHSLTRLGAPASCDCSPQPAVRGALRSVEATARQWSSPPQAILSAPPADQDPLGAFAARARTHGFTISGMAFQDAWSLDLERLRGCCIHVAAPDGRLVPFCAYNLTAADGRPLHRGVTRP